MSIETSVRVWKHSKQSGSKLLLLVALADYTNAEGWAWPSISSLCDRTRLGERYVQKMLKEIQDAGEIEIHQRKNQSNFYRILLEEGVNQSAPGGVNYSSGGGEPQFARGVNYSAPNPLIEPEENRKKEPLNGFALVEDVTNTKEEPLADTFVKEWNSLPDSIPRVRDMTEKRRKELNARAKNPKWRADWREAMRKIPESPFMTGKGPTGWVATVDWFLKPDTVTVILEGKYADRTPKPKDDPDFWRKHL